VIAALVFLMGVLIRHFFNTMHARGGMKWWTWCATAMLFIVIMWLSTLGMSGQSLDESEATIPPAAERFAQAEGFEDVTDIVLGRCSMCHAREPFYDGIHRAPKGVMLETPGEIATHAQAIYVQSGVTHAMPPANVSWMEEAERAKVVAWFNAGS
jgi:uncharacterized membrane protein